MLSNRTKTSAAAPEISIGTFEEKAHSNQQNFQQSPRSIFNGSNMQGYGREINLNQSQKFTNSRLAGVHQKLQDIQNEITNIMEDEDY